MKTYILFIILFVFTGCKPEPCVPPIKIMDPALFEYLPDNIFSSLLYRNASDSIFLEKRFEKLDTALSPNICNGGGEYYHCAFMKNETDKFEIYYHAASDTNKLIGIVIGPTQPIFNAQEFVLNIDSLALSNESITVDNITFNNVKHYTSDIGYPVTEIYYDRNYGVVAFKHYGVLFALQL